MAPSSAVHAVLFDAGHTLLGMDQARLTAYLVSRGDEVSVASVAATSDPEDDG